MARKVRVYMLRRDGIIQRYRVSRKRLKELVKVGRFKGRNLYAKEPLRKREVRRLERRPEIKVIPVRRWVYQAHVTGTVDYSQSRTQLKIDAHKSDYFKTKDKAKEWIERAKDDIWYRVANAFGWWIANVLELRSEIVKVPEDEAYRDEFYRYRDYRSRGWYEF